MEEEKENNTNAELNHLATALAKAQSQMQHAIKDSTNPFFKSSYADLASVWHACREPLTKNGLCVIQHPTVSVEGTVSILTILLHSSGQSTESTLTVPVLKRDPQAYGSAITYARRYALSAIVGISPNDDDDGNSASKREPTPPPDRFAKHRALVTPADQLVATEEDDIPVSFSKKTTAKKNEGAPEQEFYYDISSLEFVSNEEKNSKLLALTNAGCAIVEHNFNCLIKAPKQIKALAKYEINIKKYIEISEVNHE